MIREGVAYHGVVEIVGKESPVAFVVATSKKVMLVFLGEFQAVSLLAVGGVSGGIAANLYLNGVSKLGEMAIALVRSIIFHKDDSRAVRGNACCPVFIKGFIKVCIGAPYPIYGNI